MKQPIENNINTDIERIKKALFDLGLSVDDIPKNLIDQIAGYTTLQTSPTLQAAPIKKQKLCNVKEYYVVFTSETLAPFLYKEKAGYTPVNLNTMLQYTNLTEEQRELCEYIKVALLRLPCQLRHLWICAGRSSKKSEELRNHRLGFGRFVGCFQIKECGLGSDDT